MPSQTEQRVRELDDLSQRVFQVAPRIAETLRLPLRTVKSYLYPKRNGFNSRRQYINHQKFKHDPKTTLPKSNGRLNTISPFELEEVRASYDGIARQNATYTIQDAFSILSQRSVQVLEMEFFENQTLESIGSKLNLTKERVRQIRNRSLILMRQYLS
jgi:RNA polymerase sigma factor (sigma-70 family)